MIRPGLVLVIWDSHLHNAFPSISKLMLREPWPVPLVQCPNFIVSVSSLAMLLKTRPTIVVYHKTKSSQITALTTMLLQISRPFLPILVLGKLHAPWICSIIYWLLAQVMNAPVILLASICNTCVLKLLRQLMPNVNKVWLSPVLASSHASCSSFSLCTWPKFQT